MRVAGKEEGKGDEEDGIATRVACDEEGNGDGCKSNGDKGDGQASATNQHKEEGGCAAAEAASTGWQDALIKSVPRRHLCWIFAIIWRKNSNFFLLRVFVKLYLWHK